MFSSHVACWQGARWGIDVRWVVLNLVGGANAFLGIFSAHVASNEDDVAVESLPRPQLKTQHEGILPNVQHGERFDRLRTDNLPRHH